LWDLRIAKLRSSVDLFVKEGRVQASLNHLTPMEINSVRPIFPDTLDALMTLHEVRYKIYYTYFYYLLFNIFLNKKYFKNKRALIS